MRITNRKSKKYENTTKHPRRNSSRNSVESYLLISHILLLCLESARGGLWIILFLKKIVILLGRGGLWKYLVCIQW